MRACANTSEAFYTFGVFYMSEVLDFFDYRQTHRANTGAFALTARTLFGLSDFMRGKAFKPAEPDSEHTDRATERAFTEKKNEGKAADDSG